MSNNRKRLIKEVIKEADIKTTADIHNVLKDIFADTIKEMLEAELDNHLGYSKYSHQNKQNSNRRNGKTTKTVLSDLGEFELEVPRDREGSFEPEIVKKNQTNVSGIEDQIIGMYAKGMTTRDIAIQLENIYGFEASHTLISSVTDKVLPLVEEWRNRPLDIAYPIIFMDAIHFKVREDHRIVTKAAYVILGISSEGLKDVLGIWIGENESSRYWLTVLNELKNRGVDNIGIACVDGLTGFNDAIRSVYPKAEIQRCIIHQVRSCGRYVPYKDIREFNRDLKVIYSSPNEATALKELDLFEEKWAKKYSIAVSSWRRNWTELATFFKYSPEIRKIIYTTNSVESYNRQLRKVTKSKSSFPSDSSLMKMLYLATIDITKKWSQPIRQWHLILDQLNIYFDGLFDEVIF